MKLTFCFQYFHLFLVFYSFIIIHFCVLFIFNLFWIRWASWICGLSFSVNWKYFLIICRKYLNATSLNISSAHSFILAHSLFILGLNYTCWIFWVFHIFLTILTFSLCFFPFLLSFHFLNLCSRKQSKYLVVCKLLF